MKYWIRNSLIAFCLVLLTASGAYGDDPVKAPPKSAKKDVSGDSSAVVKKEEPQELELDLIEIKGNVEKPGVIVMPKRVEPHMGKIDLERSFKKELKEGVGEIMKPEDALKKVERVKSIKKAIERKRK